ncbi:hypothetical protein K3H53_17565 [Aeromonas veronii]|uniref:helix-turn-helix domain-containing transcriptional regulator n=1 Tax=Aeromonas veronii TaxID=654 RepID=UPI001F323F3D|nr:hypothetical protein [Aeromonas veronii]MCF5849083.1 hypothetical protein [Aeromonas veronii]
MEKEVFSRFQVADYLTSVREAEAYIEAAKEENDPVLLAAALEDVRQAILTNKSEQSQYDNDTQ